MKAMERSRRRIGQAVSAITKIFNRRNDEAGVIEPVSPDAGAVTRAAAQPETSAPRAVQRKTDIPMNVLENAYTPPRTSSKASFRSDGSDHGDDQEFALGVADERWNDEDRYTNKSGDPRIGTHGRSYEPREKVGKR
jgi:hypothetical protein